MENALSQAACGEERSQPGWSPPRSPLALCKLPSSGLTLLTGKTERPEGTVSLFLSGSGDLCGSVRVRGWEGVLHPVTPSPCLSGPRICACPTGLSSKTSKISSGHRKTKTRKNQLRPKAAVTEKIVITSLTSRREPSQPSLPRGPGTVPHSSSGSCPSTESEWGTRPMGLGAGEGWAISAWVVLV